MNMYKSVLLLLCMATSSAAMENFSNNLSIESLAPVQKILGIGLMGTGLLKLGDHVLETMMKYQVRNGISWTHRPRVCDVTGYMLPIMALVIGYINIKHNS